MDIRSISRLRRAAGGLSAGDMLDQLHAARLIPHTIAPDGRLQEIAVDAMRRFAGQLDLVWNKAV